MPRKPSKRQLLMAEKVVIDGMDPYNAGLEAGYAPGTARVNALETQTGKMAYLAALKQLDSVPVLPPEERAILIRRRLQQNIVNGEDKATASIKLAGQDREVNIFTPENVQGVVVIQMTPELGKIVDALELPPVREE